MSFLRCVAIGVGAFVSLAMVAGTVKRAAYEGAQQAMAEAEPKEIKVTVINHSDDALEVSGEAVDDTPVTETVVEPAEVISPVTDNA